MLQSSHEECDTDLSACCNDDCEWDMSQCAPECLIISEYLEGGGNDRAFELYNCGASYLRLTDLNVCVVRDSSTSCSSNAPLAQEVLREGETLTVCDPRSVLPGLAGACDIPNADVASFDGNDRLMLWVDVDGDGVFTDEDVIVDALGVVDLPPADDDAWRLKLFSRCDPTPFGGEGPYDILDYFRLIEDFEVGPRVVDPVAGFGRAPRPGCVD